MSISARDVFSTLTSSSFSFTPTYTTRTDLFFPVKNSALFDVSIPLSEQKHAQSLVLMERLAKNAGFCFIFYENGVNRFAGNFDRITCLVS